MRSPCVWRVRRRGLKKHFKHFDQIFDCELQCCSPCCRGRPGLSWKGGSCIITHSLPSNSQRPFPRDGVHTHTQTHKGSMCARTPSHADTHHPVIHLPLAHMHGNRNAQTWGNICKASRRVCWMEWFKKSSRNHKSDLWPPQPRPSLFSLFSFRRPAAARKSESRVWSRFFYIQSHSITYSPD